MCFEPFAVQSDVKAVVTLRSDSMNMHSIAAVPEELTCLAVALGTGMIAAHVVVLMRL